MNGYIKRLKSDPAPIFYNCTEKKCREYDLPNAKIVCQANLLYWLSSIYAHVHIRKLSASLVARKVLELKYRFSDADDATLESKRNLDHSCTKCRAQHLNRTYDKIILLKKPVSSCVLLMCDNVTIRMYELVGLVDSSIVQSLFPTIQDLKYHFFSSNIRAKYSISWEFRLSSMNSASSNIILSQFTLKIYWKLFASHTNDVADNGSILEPNT